MLLLLSFWAWSLAFEVTSFGRRLQGASGRFKIVEGAFQQRKEALQGRKSAGGDLGCGAGVL
jgi:hypothetical protein